MIKINKNLQIAIEAAIAAGKAIMEIYENKDFEVEEKKDSSPLTIADKKSNEVINNFLIPTNIPVISEENNQVDFKERQSWNKCWIVDPLDGTKEFIKRNGEFTVNIALVENGAPIIGVIFAPAINYLYFGNTKDSKAFVCETSGKDGVDDILKNAQLLNPSKADSVLKIVGSRSHMNETTLAFIEKKEKMFPGEVEIVSKGSSLKFCLVAEGSAHIYPRFAPTMEWDTAAGQAICEAVGINSIWTDTGDKITYNRENLLNGHFIVSNEG